jgi:hypothetical protein
MANVCAKTIYVVLASNGDRRQFWAAATSAERAATVVQDSLPRGWTAMFTGWRLSSEKTAELKMRVDTVRKIKQRG